MSAEQAKTTVERDGCDDHPSDNLQTTAEQQAACRSVGTKQCAAICLSHSCYIPLGECPSVGGVWTPAAIKAERRRRANGPLLEQVE